MKSYGKEFLHKRTFQQFAFFEQQMDKQSINNDDEGIVQQTKKHDKLQ